MNNIHSRGFSLAELLVLIAILGALLGIAAPSYRDFVLETRMTEEANEFLAALTLARSEAIKRNGTVTVCKSSNGTACTGNWQQGWLVFTDVATGTPPQFGTFESATDTILRVHGSLSSGSTLTGKRLNSGDTEIGALDYITFLPDGRSQLDAAPKAMLHLCSSGATVDGRSVSVVLGRAQVTRITTC